MSQHLSLQAMLSPTTLPSTFALSSTCGADGTNYLF